MRSAVLARLTGAAPAFNPRYVDFARHHGFDIFACTAALNPMPYDIAHIRTVHASPQFRVTLDTNHYSVPAEYAGARLTVKAYRERVCLYHHDKLIARHARSYDCHQDFEDRDHPKALLNERRAAREQRL